MRLFSILLMLLSGLIPVQTNAQSPYYLSPKYDAITATGAMALWGTGVYLRRHDKRLSVEEIEQLDVNELESFRRNIITNQSLTAGRWSDHLKNSSQFLPLVLLADKGPRSDFKEMAVLYLETTMITRGLTSMTKLIRHRTRPFVYNENIAIGKKSTIRARQSFFSGHTSKTAAMTFFTAKVFADYHPDSKWKPFVWTMAATVPAVTGYLRVKAGQHFPTDVMVGYAVGGAVGYLVPHFHKTNRQKKDSSSSSFKMGGGLTGMWAEYRF